MADYNARFSVREDFELFEQAGLKADSTRKHYILDALNEEQLTRNMLHAKEEGGTEKGGGEGRGAAAMQESVSCTR